MPALIVIALWGSVGGSRMVIFIAGLQGIPHELYEAAHIDGAGLWQRFRHVTLPLLTPTIFFNMVLGVIGAFSVFTVAYVGTQGGPANATYFYVLHIYNRGFADSEMGYASALAWIFFAIVHGLHGHPVLASAALGPLRGRRSDEPSPTQPPIAAARRRARGARRARSTAPRRSSTCSPPCWSSIFMGPFLWTVATSLKTPSRSALFPPILFPAAPRFENYVDVFRQRADGALRLQLGPVTLPGRGRAGRSRPRWSPTASAASASPSATRSSCPAEHAGAAARGAADPELPALQVPRLLNTLTPLWLPVLLRRRASTSSCCASSS